MRKRWKLIGGAGLASLGFALFVLGHSGKVAGQGTTDSTSTNPDPNHYDPSIPYDLGPHPIDYTQLSAADQVGVDQIHQTEDLGQPAGSYQAFAAAAAQVDSDAQAQIAARQVGLVGTASDGVSP